MLADCDFLKDIEMYYGEKEETTYTFSPGVKAKLVALGKYVQNMNPNLTTHESNIDLSEYPILEDMLKRAKMYKEIKNHDNIKYSQLLKHVAIKLYIMSGKAAYEFMAKNLPLPQPSTVKNWISANSAPNEGEIDFIAARQHFSKYSRTDVDDKIYCYGAEDATSVVKRIEFRLDTDQIVGFVSPLNENTGLPSVNHFPASTPSEVYGYFHDYKKAHLVEAIALIPLEKNTPPYILTMFGTDGAYNWESVKAR